MNQPKNTTNHESAPTSPEPGTDAMTDFLTFRKFATPTLVQIVFWTGTLVFLIWGGALISEASNRYGTNEIMVWTGIAIMFIGPAVLRIAAELVMIVFRIHDQLGLLAKAGD
ncbi:MAG: DUF4282 domain-containing protein [Xanthomonadaceae bacterium]|nr:DUF4282 domain-containing protein [Xanthomonadaceae bacterium]